MNGNYISLFAAQGNAGYVSLLSSKKVGCETAGSVASTTTTNPTVAYQGGETAGSVAYSGGCSSGSSSGGSSFSAVA